MEDIESKIIADIHSNIDEMIRGTQVIVDAHRHQRNIGRNLALAISHLEDAQDKLNRAIRASFLDKTAEKKIS